MSVQIVEWPAEIIELNRELANGLHPKLQKILHDLHSSTSFPERIAHIAAYCDMVLDGMYSIEQISELCEKLIPRLQAKRERPGGILILH